MNFQAASLFLLLLKRPMPSTGLDTAVRGEPGADGGSGTPSILSLPRVSMWFWYDPRRSWGR